jgi:hypothetical protein
MEIDQLIRYHNQAAELLESSIAEMKEGNDAMLRGFVAGSDFHRQAIILLLAAKQAMFRLEGLDK